ncbi:hypothetical protein [Aeromonas phage AS-szw]|uniref:Uncharacterized protein n=1 Tax=Aeromonas phage AS-szw TaxID=2026114 RepID=A0A291LE01_9CAUD|nr:hypothetical protein [Aeromonas phage AS-szw]
MKIKFKSEAHMNEFANINLGWSSHNKDLVLRYGMNPFEVEVDITESWWDTVDGDFAIHKAGEGKYFEIVVAS